MATVETEPEEPKKAPSKGKKKESLIKEAPVVEKVPEPIPDSSSEEEAPPVVEKPKKKKPAKKTQKKEPEVVVEEKKPEPAAPKIV